MTDGVVFHLRSNTSELGRAAAEVAQFGASCGMAEKDVFDVTLALDEVLTNVIWYAFEDDSEHEITVRVELAAGEVVVQVEDDGREFDPLTVEALERDLEQPVHERRVGGLGIFLVRQAMDQLAYRREMGKNVFTMRRRIAKKE